NHGRGSLLKGVQRLPHVGPPELLRSFCLAPCHPVLAHPFANSLPLGGRHAATARRCTRLTQFILRSAAIPCAEHRLDLALLPCNSRRRPSAPRRARSRTWSVVSPVGKQSSSWKRAILTRFWSNRRSIHCRHRSVRSTYLDRAARVTRSSIREANHIS